MEPKPAFHEPIEVNFTDLEIIALQNNLKNLQIYMIRKVRLAIHTEQTRPWREILGSDKE